MHRGLALEADAARELGVEHDEGNAERLLLGLGVGTRIVQLVEHVRVDAPGSPFAVVGFRRARALDCHVVGVDLGRHSIEEDAPLAMDSRRADPATEQLDGQRFDERTAHLVPQRSYTAAIRTALPDDAVLVEDVTQIGFAAHLFYDHLSPRTFLSSGAAGTLGAATAVAIGASATTDRPVVGIVGDGGFLFTATELATAVQHGIPCNILLFNDGAYGNVRRIQKTRFGPHRTIASALQNPDFDLFARSFGVQYQRADSPEALVPALRRAIDHDGASLIEVPVEEMPDPWPHLRLPAVRGDAARG